MPELPEVETTRRGVSPQLEGATVRGVLLRQPSLRWPVPPELPSLLAGRTVRSVSRRAKYLLVDFDHGTLIVHLGMSGSLRFVPPGTLPDKHDHIDIELGETVLRYRDPRRFGAMLWQQGPAEAHPLLANLGPEPLSDAFDGSVLFEATRRRGSAIKLSIMDNHVVVGVGNIYANESLFYAGIHPARESRQLGRADCDRLATEIKRVLARAIEAGGSSLRDFTDAKGKPGYFQQSYKVYGRAGLSCHDCGALIAELRQGQRSSCFCPHCQPL